MVSQRDLRTGNVDCGETGVDVGSLASAKSDCFRLVGIYSPPRPRLPSQSQVVFALWPVPIYIAWLTEKRACEL